MEYNPNTSEDRTEMLRAIGIGSIDELFRDVPESVRKTAGMNLPPGLSELELLRECSKLAARNASLDEYACFLGAGAYDHFVPSAIDAIISRQEFFTAYTPYQPEISQGTLTAIFEYQTMISELSGLPVANASLYDGGSALAEAALMAVSSRKSADEILIASTVHPESREVLETYAKFRNVNVKTVNYNKNGTLDLEKLESEISPQTAALIVQSPNFFGMIEDLEPIGAILREKNPKALFIVSASPISMTLLKPPGECGANIVIGEGQSLGLSLSFGGPYLGFIAAEEKLLRKMPGRIVGETIDADGKRGFVLTIQSREQHIRREKATSNICSNQALCALAATVYMTLLGKNGLRDVAYQSLQKANYAKESLLKTGRFSSVFEGPFFQEFLLRSETPIAELNKRLLSEKIIGGLELERYYPELPNTWLLALTEKRTKEEIDKVVAILSKN